MKNKYLHITFLLCTVLLLSCYNLFAQNWKLINTVEIKNLDKVSIDPYSNIYISDFDGNAKRYDSLGNYQLVFSPVKKGDATLLEGWRYVNTFIFYRNFQQYVILDRFFNQSSNIDINEEEIGYARLATFTIDNNIWIIDDDDFSLKKYDPVLNKVQIHTYFDLLLDPTTYDLTFIREYQNLLFINDKNSGILIFDNFGNYKTKLPFKGLDYFSFYKDELCYIQEGKIKLYNVYTNKDREFSLPPDKKYRYVLMTASKVYLFTDTAMEIYSGIF